VPFVSGRRGQGNEGGVRVTLRGVVKAADVVITMGCGDACPIYPGKRYEDWELQDPAGQPVEVVRRIRDDIDARVRRLLAELVPGRTGP
jgi:protein-tyrosine-phosphatase